MVWGMSVPHYHLLGQSLVIIQFIFIFGTRPQRICSLIHPYIMRVRRRAGGALALFSVMAAVALLPCARAVAVNLTVKAPLDIGLAPSYVRASYPVVHA